MRRSDRIRKGCMQVTGQEMAKRMAVVVVDHGVPCWEVLLDMICRGRFTVI